MFGRKILSVVGLLFLGNFVSGTALSPCDTTASSCGEVTGYCVHSDNKIYPSGTSCYDSASGFSAAITQAGIYAFYDGTKIATLGESGSSVEITDLTKLTLFDCTYTAPSASCTQKYGYILIGDKYFNIPQKSITKCGEVSLFGNVCTTDTPTKDKYCLNDDDSKIYNYGIGDDTSDLTDDCVLKEAIDEAGVYVFQDDGTNDGADIISLGESTSEITEKDNLMLYQCSFGTDNDLTCSRTYGYIEDKYSSDYDDYYEISADGTVTKKANGELASDCSSGNTGKLQQNNKLCLFGKASNPLESNVITTAGTYIMNNVAGNIFTNGLGATDESETTKSITIQATANIFSLDVDEYDYCIDTTNNAVKPTFEEYCDNETKNCAKKAECSDTLCKREDGNNSAVTPTCSIVIGDTSTDCTDNGYYLVSGTTGTLAPTEEANNYLAHCTNSGQSCRVVPEVELKIGYYKYADKSNKYIKCIGYKQCSVVSVVSNKANCKASGVAVGDIINDTSKDVLCLDVTTNGYKGIPLNANAEYFTEGISGSIFNTVATKYVKVVVANSSSVVLSDTLGTDALEYAYADVDFKSYARAATKVEPAAICAANKVIIEFKHALEDCANDCTTETPYYILHVKYQWPNTRSA